MPLVDMLSRGYFPKELPRPFVTDSFATLITSTSALPADFSKNATTRTKFPIAKPGRYSLARVGLLRRHLSICNPLHHFQLCRELSTNWSSITAKAGGTPLAATAPEMKPSGRAIDGKHPQRDRPILSHTSRLGRKYLLRTDIFPVSTTASTLTPSRGPFIPSRWQK